MTVRVTTERFDPGAELNTFLSATDNAGAAATFTGVVRSNPQDPITALTLECYPELALNQLNDLLAQATNRFDLLAATIIHRYGTLHPGEPIVQVMTLSPHRQAAFEAAEFLMDFLKTDAPFWKQETTPQGTHWVEAKSADDEAKARWE
ncbi:molybdenum cofactor biosynthesis protein MoaE [Devosia submarina]|uniref:molybdenum cofactor biosynthesis protein MoaE n=1 Tax=Devosia submarina TaxID=1173082 RepID=UPI000D344D7D|nr:molybdenum cofactor biosynthesis protein MoaE [Devosia submarina]